MSGGQGSPSGRAAENGTASAAGAGLERYVPDAVPPLVDALSSLYEHAIDRLLLTPERVASAAEGKRLLARDEDDEVMADQVQRVVVLAVPVVRTLARGARFTRVPWVLVASTAFSVASTLRAGVREVQLVGSLVAHRLEQETGRPAAPRLVKRLALELYLAPRRTPSTADEPLPLRRLLQRWLFKGALGRDTRRAAAKALDAAERLDVRPYVITLER